MKNPIATALTAMQDQIADLTKLVNLQSEAFDLLVKQVNLQAECINQLAEDRQKEVEALQVWTGAVQNWMLVISQQLSGPAPPDFRQN